MGSSPSGESLSSNKVGIEFHQGKTYFSDKFISISPVKTVSPKKIAPAMSILMSVRAPVGDVNMTNREICIGRGLAAIIPCELALLNYLYFFLMTRKEALEHEATGSTFKAISKDNLIQLLIPLPPLAEQKRIITKLNQLLPICDYLFEINKQ